MAVENPQASPVVNQETDTLLLNYRDPFIGEFVRVRQNTRHSPVLVEVFERGQEQPSMPDFTFKGLIGNGVEQKAMVMKNGSLYMLGPGEVIGGFKVLRISPELLTVQNGKHKIEVIVK